MTVAELIEELRKYQGDMTIVTRYQDDSAMATLVKPKHFITKCFSDGTYFFRGTRPICLSEPDRYKEIEVIEMDCHI